MEESADCHCGEMLHNIHIQTLDTEYVYCHGTEIYERVVLHSALVLWTIFRDFELVDLRLGRKRRCSAS